MGEGGRGRGRERGAPTGCLSRRKGEEYSCAAADRERGSEKEREEEGGGRGERERERDRLLGLGSSAKITAPGVGTRPLLLREAWSLPASSAEPSERRYSAARRKLPPASPRRAALNSTSSALSERSVTPCSKSSLPRHRGARDSRGRSLLRLSRLSLSLSFFFFFFSSSFGRRRVERLGGNRRCKYFNSRVCDKVICVRRKLYGIIFYTLESGIPIDFMNFHSR